MAARVRFRDAQGREGLIELGAEPVYVGRAPDCAIRSDDALVSRRHSRIRREGNAFFIEDLDSSNGTKVNNVRVQKHMLRNDDAVICGSLTLLFMEDAAPPAPPPTVVSVIASMPSPAPPPPAFVAEPGISGAEAQKLRDSIESLRLEIDDARADRETQVAENMRLRAEQLRFQQRIEDLRGELQASGEVVEEHKRIIDDLRPEIEKALAERDKSAMAVSEANEKVASLTRQLERAQEEIARQKGENEKLKKANAELTAAKEDGYRKLNEHLAEVEQVRQVVREQERMLEERRVGLINLEESLKELRGKNEQRQREVAQLRAERDALQKENQRLSQA